MNKILALIGALLTSIYCLACLWLFQGKIDAFPDLELNEIGDFLAGVCSPLAFLWLVLGFFQQGLELSASRKALMLQAEELKNSVAQQKSLVEVNRLQFDADSEARAIQNSQLVHSMQPVLAITRSLSSSSGGIIQQSFTLTNYGHRITQLKVQTPPGRTVGLAQQYAVLASNAEIKFSIDARPDDIQNFILTFTYSDGMAESRAIRFQFLRIETGSFPQYKVELVTGKVVDASS